MAVLMKHSDLSKDIDDLSKQVIDCVFAVHKELGPGFLEKIYEDALIAELEDRRISYNRQILVPIIYKGKKLPSEYRLDLIVEDKIILELKTVERIAPVHEAQILSYMKQCGVSLGFIINFNETLIKNGIKRIIQSNNLRNFASSR